MRRLRLLASLAALAVLAAGASERASAQADAGTGFPSKPIRFVVGYAAGGGNDIFARLVGDKVREFLGQPVVIENKPGGGGRLAGEYVMGQPADGYTVLVGAAGMMALVPVIYPKTSYHPTRTYSRGRRRTRTRRITRLPRLPSPSPPSCSSSRPACRGCRSRTRAPMK